MFHFAPPDPNTGIPQTFNLDRHPSQQGQYRAGSEMYTQTPLPAPAVPGLTDAPNKHTLQPITTGTSVVSVKYQGGVIVAADTLGSYGSLARFKNVERVHKVNGQTLLGAGGDISDFQYIQGMLGNLVTEDESHMDGHTLSPKEIHSFVSRVMYNRRSKFDPLWNSLVVAGRRNGTNFLGYVDLVGTAFDDDYIVTGLGAHLVLPIIRKAYRPDLTYDEARKLVEECLKVLFYRDCRTINKVQISHVDDEGVHIDAPIHLDTNWDVANFKNLLLN